MTLSDLFSSLMHNVVSCTPVHLKSEFISPDLLCFAQLVEEKRALEEAERRASEEYIQRLLAEEEERMEEERRCREEQQLENDEKLARLLSLELVRSQDLSHIRSHSPTFTYTPLCSNM